MMYFVVLFVSPLYFALRGKWGGFILNAILYLLALLTVFVFGVGVIFWLLGVGHAMWHLRQEMMEKQADLIATKMADKMKDAR